MDSVNGSRQAAHMYLYHCLTGIHVPLAIFCHLLLLLYHICLTTLSHFSPIHHYHLPAILTLLMPVVRVSLESHLLAEYDATILVEGNHYFPPTSVRKSSLSHSNTRSVCPWKGCATPICLPRRLFDALQDRGIL